MSYILSSVYNVYFFLNTNKYMNDFRIINFHGLELITYGDLINYSSLHRQIKQTTRHGVFRNFMFKNKKILEIIALYENNIEQNNFSILLKNKIFKIINRGVKPKYFGTYGPKYLLKYVLIHLDTKYYKIFNENTYITDTGIEFPTRHVNDKK